MVLALARSSEPWCFPAGSCFFSTLFYCQQYCQQLQATESRQKGFCSRISAFFEAVLLPVAAFFRSCSTASSLEKGCFSRISDDTLGSFFTWFWHSLVLQSHGVFLPAAAFFRSCSTVSSTASSYKQQNLVKKVSFLGFQLFSKLFYCQLRLATESLDLSKNAVFLGF